MKTTIEGCARCAGTHVDLEFTEFKGRPIVDGEIIWKYWALCPATGDPILMLEYNENTPRSVILQIQRKEAIDNAKDDSQTPGV